MTFHRYFVAPDPRYRKNLVFHPDIGITPSYTFTIAFVCALATINGTRTASEFHLNPAIVPEVVSPM